MPEASEPLFLTRKMVDEIHEAAISAYGGLGGVLNEHLLESAINQPRHTHYPGGGDLFDVAAAYTFHIVADHPYWDGNKRTGSALPVADHKMDRKALAAFFRESMPA